MASQLPESMGKLMDGFIWLMADALILVFLLAALLGYKDFDEPMRRLFRLAIVAYWAYVWVSALHLLVYTRKANAGSAVPRWASYGLFAVKGFIVAAVGVYALSAKLI